MPPIATASLSCRQLLQALLTEPLVFTPFDEGGARGYRFRGRATLDGLIEGAVNVVKVYSTAARHILGIARVEERAR